MKIKIAVTGMLLVLLAGVSLVTLRSFEGLNLKLKMEEPSQVTMEMLPETEPVKPKAAEMTSDKDDGKDKEKNKETEQEIPSNPNAPVLKLSTSQVELKVGDTFTLTDKILLVEDIKDDVDDRDSLYRNIRIQGEYDLDTPGEYTLTYTVTDTNGNQSDPKILKLIVKA